MRFSPGLQHWALDNGETAGARKSIRVQLLDGSEVDIQVDRHETQAEGGVIYGSATDEPGSHVLLAYVGEAVAGTMFFPSRGLFQVRYAGDGQHRVMELNPTWSPPCMVLIPPVGAHSTTVAPVAPAATGDALLTSVGGSPPVDTAIPTGITRADASPVVVSDANTKVEFLVAYTTTAKTANGGDSGIAALINASVATASQPFINSQAGVTLRLAHRAEITYTESGSLATDLTRLKNTTDGHLDTVAALRNNYKADLVSLIVHTGTDAAGIAYLWTAGTSASAFAPWACSVVLDA